VSMICGAVWLGMGRILYLRSYPPEIPRGVVMTGGART
jgi:hypothetical protein